MLDVGYFSQICVSVAGCQLAFSVWWGQNTSLKHAKDLGEIVQYNKACFSRPLISRVDEAVTRMDRLINLPLSIEQKARRIQAGILPLGLYAADTHYMGMKHFDRLRRAAANAMLGAFHHINPYIACMCLSKHLMDPLLFVIVVALRSLRRLCALNDHIAWLFVELASSYEAKWAYGPASALSNYLAKIGLWITSEAQVHSNDGIVCDVTKQSCLEIKHCLSAYWYKAAFSYFIHRKGSPTEEININLQRRVFAKLTSREQKLIALNVTGGFQTNAIKHKWDDETQVKCDHCSQLDNRSHRLLSCEATHLIRVKHPHAVEVLGSINPDWLYLPISTFHEDFVVFKKLVDSFKLPKISVEFSCPQNRHVYFTDGGCLRPAIPEARLASWAVVRDHTESFEHACAMTSIALFKIGILAHCCAHLTWD
jgi:hypothetical protein